MSDVSPYGTHQHASEGAVRAYALVGDHVDQQTENSVGASPATFSTAPYKKPGTHAYALCSKTGCRGLRKKGSDWCRHHEPDTAP